MKQNTSISLPFFCLTLWTFAGTAWSQKVEGLNFQRDIRPILSDKCFACHGPDSETREADLRLDNREDALEVLSPEAPAASELVRRILSTDPGEQMPPPEFKNQLSPEENQRLRQWIDLGAEYESHWSFEPVGETAVPELAAPHPRSSWPNNEIDQFVLQRLLEIKQEPAAPASRSRWLRRVYFDLIGLPPTPEELERFLNDDSAEACERVVDGLLERPEYGERMANAWLEVARYSDTYGYQVDRDRYVWPWRDWVIQAYNNNLPYDQFVTWQIAGDLLPNPTREQILATTFCRLHPQKVEGGSTPEEFRVEYVADRTHTVATAFLGLTLECARCHDHKYDPLSTQDYYQLFAYFNNIDEAGLYSYFTNSVPTPTLTLESEAQALKLKEAEQAIQAKRARLEAVRGEQHEAFENWLSNLPEAMALPSPIKHLDFESAPGGNNKQVEGVVGQAVELTGDDGIGLDVGNFNRSQPFSISLWLWTPDTKDRAVVFHRSRAWTDAGSRGYELLIDEGHLAWSLIHFWPGNAISIRAKNALPLKTWVHVTVTYDGSARADGLSLYINGAKASTQIVRDHLVKNVTGGGGDNITIGERFRDRGFTQGRVDEFLVFDTELGEIEAQQIFESETWSDLRSAASIDDDLKALLKEHFLKRVNPKYQEHQKELEAAYKSLHDQQNGLTEIMVMKEMQPRRQTFILKRGAYDSPTTPVAPAPPTALRSLQTDTSDRRGLAAWLTSQDNPLTARVAVNRLWQLCFGHGLVRTPEDFGSQGSPPTHPELLDWLAWDFMSHGWDQKRLLKKIVLSSTYRQTSDVSREAWIADPENKELSRGPRYRLPAEMIRDQALFVSGLLVQQQGGGPVRPYEVSVSFKPSQPDKGDGLYRRSLYTYWKRTAPAPVMLALDASKRDVCTVKRERTSSPLQAIVLLNDPQMLEAARVLAESLLKNQNDIESIVESLMLKAASRSPSELEKAELIKLYKDLQASFRETPEEAKSLSSIGEKTPDEDLNPIDVAALTTVVSTVLNLDASVMKR
jgi:hypothetical protein